MEVTRSLGRQKTSAAVQFPLSDPHEGNDLRPLSESVALVPANLWSAVAGEGRRVGGLDFWLAGRRCCEENQPKVSFSFIAVTGAENDETGPSTVRLPPPGMAETRNFQGIPARQT